MGCNRIESNLLVDIRCLAASRWCCHHTGRRRRTANIENEQENDRTFNQAAVRAQVVVGQQWTVANNHSVTSLRQRDGYLGNVLVAKLVAGTRAGEIDTSDRFEDFFHFPARRINVSADHLTFHQLLQQTSSK